MNEAENRKLGRVQYWEGQMLRACDFADIQRIEAQRRWWHNRALHKAYGVYQGMSVSADSTLGAIIITPGVAYDCFGHELVLACTAKVAFPFAPTDSVGSLTLVGRYREMGCRDVAADRADVCCLGSVPSCPQTVEFIWMADQRQAFAEGVPLGEMRFDERKATRFRVFKPLPTHRPLARPLVGSGSTVPGNTSWQPWVYTATDYTGTTTVTQIGVQTTIDTSAAGFTDIPQYFAWLEGSIWNAQASLLVPALLPSLADESISGFTFRLILLPPSSTTTTTPPFYLVQDPYLFALFAQQQQLYVSWLGCQMPAKTNFLSSQSLTGNKVLQPELVSHAPL